MKTMFRLLLLLIITSLLLPSQLQAQNSNFTLGGEYDNDEGKPLMKIEINANGTWQIYRKVNASTYQKQFDLVYYIFAVRMQGQYKYMYRVNFVHGDYSYNTNYNEAPLTPTDIDSDIGPGVEVEYVTKRYTASGAYSTDPFYVDQTIAYDKKDPNNITITVECHFEQVLSNRLISFAYGFLPFLNSSDRMSAITMPDIRGLNGSINDNTTYTFTTTEVQSLSFVGAVSTVGAGIVMGMYPMEGRQFDRAASGSGTSTWPDLYANPSGGSSYGANTFNYYDNGTHGMALAYDNIQPGVFTKIKTGMLFDEALPAEMDYGWLDINADTVSKHLTVPLNTLVSFRVAGQNYNTTNVNNAGFRVDMPTAPTTLPIVGTPTSTGFNSAPYTNNATYYRMVNGVIPSLGTGVVLMPVSTAKYGEWLIDQSNLSYLSYFRPFGNTDPAILTVTAEVNHASTTAGVEAGHSINLTVKLPQGVPANEDITVNLSYAGDLGSFTSMPTTMIIHQGDNSGTFQVTAAAPGIANIGDAITITITDTDDSAVTPGTDVLTLSITPKVYYIPVNPHLRSMIVKQ